MDVLIVEPLDFDVLHWLGGRHAVRIAPELAYDPQGFRQALAQVRALIIPPAVALDARALQRAPWLRIVGRLSAGAENIDLEACTRAGVEVVRPATASAQAEAEFVVGALLQLLRRVPVLNGEGLLVGREIGGATVGVVGMSSAVKPLAALMTAFGARTLGYDPAMHANDPAWAANGIEPVGLQQLMQESDAVCVLMGYAQRFAGLFGERLLAESRQDQVIVSLAHSGLFNDAALAWALSEGPLAAAWFDSLEPGLLDPGRPLAHIDTLQVTPRVASTTLQSRRRSAWAVATRIDEFLRQAPPRGQLSPPRPSVLAGLEGDSRPA